MADRQPADDVFRIAPLDPERHDRAAFSCGVPALDNFLRLTAKKHHADGFARVWVAVPRNSERVVGYYAINTHAVSVHDLPASVTKRAPPSRDIPAAYISMLAVDKEHQSLGLGRLLFADCLLRIVRLSLEIGISVALLDVFDDGNESAVEARTRFYARLGFNPLPGHTLRLYMSVKDIVATRGTID